MVLGLQAIEELGDLSSFQDAKTKRNTEANTCASNSDVLLL